MRLLLESPPVCMGVCLRSADTNKGYSKQLVRNKKLYIRSCCHASTAHLFILVTYTQRRNSRHSLKEVRSDVANFPEGLPELELEHEKSKR